MTEAAVRAIAASPDFSLAQTCGPVAWARGRWPNVDWRDGGLTWVGWEGTRAVWRRVRACPDGRLVIAGTAAEAEDRTWATAVLGLDQQAPSFTDPVIDGLHARYPGLRPFSSGSLFDGLVSSIVGQSISVAAAAVTEARLAALFVPPLDLDGRNYWPMPRPEQLAEAVPALVRTSGVTNRRAEAIVVAARACLSGELPDPGRDPLSDDGIRQLAAASDTLVLECNQPHPIPGRMLVHMIVDDVRTLRAEFPRLPFLLTHVGADVTAAGIAGARIPDDLETLHV